MRLKNVKWILILLFAIGLSNLQAQTSLNVKENSGTQTSFVLSDLKKLIFTSGNMSVMNKAGNSTDFALTNVRYMNFANITAIDEINSEENSRMMLYPNPVLDRLQVRYESETGENVQIRIIDIQAKVLYQQNLKSQIGTNYINIPIESFQKGIYLCRLQNGNKIEINKFIKY